MDARPPRIRECDSLGVGIRESEWVVGDITRIRECDSLSVGIRESEWVVGDITVGRHWNDKARSPNFTTQLVQIII